MNFFKVLAALVTISCIYCNDENNTSENVFYPTNEWQVVKQGQKIPAGLHIRSDFNTGVTEAKILDKKDEDSKDNAMSVSVNKESYSNDNNSAYSPEQLKRMLKGIKDDGPVNNEEKEINGTKFRSYEELKKDFETMNLSIKTDLEIIRELLDELKGNIDHIRTTAILSDLEYYLHQIDNAQNFVDMGGLVFLHQFLDSDKSEIRSEALRCLSSALQGNSKVKVEAMKNGTLSRLLLLSKTSSDISTINQIFIAVSALTRQFPIAQLAFINGGGLQISGQIFDRFSDIEDEKIRIRLTTMVSDWLKEMNIADLKTLSADKQNEIIDQYQRVDLKSALIDNGWCARFNTIWSFRSDRSIDYLDKLIVSITNIYPICRSQLDNDRIKSFLSEAHQTISVVASNDSDDFYFRDLLTLISDTETLIESDHLHSEL